MRNADPPGPTERPGDDLTSDEALHLLRRSLSPAAPAWGTTRALLAVSGGPDSLALLLLVAENLPALRALGFDFLVVTVDHQLRPASSEEARGVARLCGRLGLSHHTLPWLEAKPSGNLAAEARAARYRLLAAHARTAGARVILTAHHQDDQIETHFLAAARGAGDRGLAGMRELRILEPGILLLRPFLSVPGARLKATTAARGVAAADDPSNRDLRFDRARLRIGLRLDEAERAACLARIATHAQRRDAEDAAMRERAQHLVAAGALRCDAFGCVTVSADAFGTMDDPLADRFLGLLIRAVAGSEHIPARASIRTLAGRLQGGGDVAATLGGTAVRGNAIFTFMREYGRYGIESLDPSGRYSLLFDRRFKLFTHDFKGFSEGDRVAAFGRFGRGRARERTLPVLMGEDGVIRAVPALLAARFPSDMAELPMVEDVSARLFSDLFGFAKICTKS